MLLIYELAVQLSRLRCGLAARVIPGLRRMMGLGSAVGSKSAADQQAGWGALLSSPLCPAVCFLRLIQHFLSVVPTLTSLDWWPGSETRPRDKDIRLQDVL